MGTYVFFNVRAVLPTLKPTDRSAIQWLIEGNDMAAASAPPVLPGHPFFDELIGQSRSPFLSSYGEWLPDETSLDWCTNQELWRPSGEHKAHATYDAKTGVLSVSSALKNSWTLCEKLAEYLIALGATGYIDAVSEDRDLYTGKLPRKIYLDTDKRYVKPTTTYSGFGC